VSSENMSSAGHCVCRCVLFYVVSFLCREEAVFFDCLIVLTIIVIL
jgi:hypothetical protein